MRKLLLAGFAVTLLTGIASAQVDPLTQAYRDDIRELLRLARDSNNISSACVDAAGVTRNLDEIASIGQIQFRCAQIFGDGLKPNGSGWIIVSPVGIRLQKF